MRKATVIMQLDIQACLFVRTNSHLVLYPLGGWMSRKMNKMLIQCVEKIRFGHKIWPKPGFPTQFLDSLCQRPPKNMQNPGTEQALFPGGRLFTFL